MLLIKHLPTWHLFPHLLILHLFKFLHLFLLQHLHSLLLPLPLLFPLLPLSCPNCLSNPLLNPQPHLIFLYNTIKIHLISEINNSMLLSIVNICTLLFELDLVEKNCQRDHTNVLIVVLDMPYSMRKCFLSKAPAGEIAFREFLEFQQQFEE